MTPPKKAITVAAAQLPAIPLANAAQALEEILTAVDHAASRSVDLLILPEAAYPAYYLPSVETYRSAGALPNVEFLTMLSERAKRHTMHIVCGYIEDRGHDLTNAAVLIDDAGTVVGTYRKTFLWGDDNKVFAPGEELPVFKTRLGKIGIAICADVRAPEVPACLASRGAEIIAVPTCWVNVAPTPGEFYNPQPHFMIQTRTRELSLPFACANKFGTETDDLSYCGFSLIVDANGETLAKAPPDEPAILVAKLKLARAGKPPLPDWTRGRICSTSPPEQPDTGDGDPLKLAAVPPGLIQPSDDEQNDPLRRLAEEGVTLVASTLPSEETAEDMMVYARSLGMRLVAHPFEPRVLFDRFGSYGIIPGEDITSFAPARAMALDGAALLFITDAPDDLGLLRTRAAENRIFLVGTAADFAAIIAPDGRILDHCHGDNLRPLIQPIDLAAAADKHVFHDTHIFDQRRPKAYADALR